MHAKFEITSRKQIHLFVVMTQEHFNLPGHSGFLNDVSVTLIDKRDPKDPTK